MSPESGGAACAEALIREAVCRAAAGGCRQTPHQLARDVAAQQGVSKKRVYAAIQSLVHDGRLAFTARCGTSFLEPSILRPMPVSERIWLCPSGCSAPENAPADRIFLRLRTGAAFGLGDHPTTRLALRGLEFAFAQGQGRSALDIGTGTGVLAIAAALLGAERVLGVDIDPCARSEAAANIAENGLSEKIEIRDTDPGRIGGVFSLVLANLRPPTLSRLAPEIGALSAADAMLVLSGFRPDEWGDLAPDFQAGGWRRAWAEIEGGWMGVVCRREGKSPRRR